MNYTGDRLYTEDNYDYRVVLVAWGTVNYRLRGERHAVMSYSVKSLNNAPVILVTLHTDYQPQEHAALLADLRAALDQAAEPRVVILDSFLPDVSLDTIMHQQGDSALENHEALLYAKVRNVYTVQHDLLPVGYPADVSSDQASLDQLVFPHAYEAVDYARRHVH